MAVQLNPVPLAGLSGVARRLVGEGALPEADARKAVEDATRQKVPLGAWLVDNGLVSGRQLAIAQSAEFGLPLLDIEAIDLTQLPMGSVREDLVTKHKALPLFKRGNRLFVGVADPTNLHGLDEIKFQTNHLIEPILIDRDALQRAIEIAMTATSTTMEMVASARWKRSSLAFSFAVSP